MLTVQNTAHFRIESPSIVTIGTFDGVHIGHQKILARLAALKAKTGLKTVVFTFDPHPRSILFPEQTDLKLLTTTAEKLVLLKKYGVDVAVVYPFSKAFSQLSSEAYINDILVKQLRVQHLVIGYDHKFGSNRQGNIATLKQYALEKKFKVEEISAQDVDSIVVSSTKIRKAIENGNMEQAEEFLGYSFCLNGTVIMGKQLGRTLGYPTANLLVSQPEKIIPANGVYLVEVSIHSKKYFGMMNIGTNPTTDSDNKIKPEVHIFNFEADIYGKEIFVEFKKRLRDEKKFSGLNELKMALHEDKENCMRLLSVAQ